MDKVRVAKELVRIAKSLMADDEDYEKNLWQVWSIDCWGNEEDGWDFNDRSRVWQFECDSDDEKQIEKCFEESLREHGCKVVPFEYDCYDFEEPAWQVNDAKTGEYLWQINKELGRY